MKLWGGLRDWWESTAVLIVSATMLALDMPAFQEKVRRDPAGRPRWRREIKATDRPTPGSLPQKRARNRHMQGSGLGLLVQVQIPVSVPFISESGTPRAGPAPRNALEGRHLGFSVLVRTGPAQSEIVSGVKSRTVVKKRWPLHWPLPCTDVRVRRIGQICRTCFSL